MTATQTGAQVGDVVELHGSRRLAATVPHRRHPAVRAGRRFRADHAHRRREPARRVRGHPDGRSGASTRAPRSTQAVAEEALESAPRHPGVAQLGACQPRRHAQHAHAPSRCSANPGTVPVSDTSIAMHPTWVANNLTAGRVLLSACDPGAGAVPRADRRRPPGGVRRGGGGRARRCDRRRQHQHLRRVLQPALQPARAASCRVTRTRMAIDMNTVSNCQGCVPADGLPTSCGSSAVTGSRGAATSAGPTACTSSGSASAATSSPTRRSTARTSCRPQAPVGRRAAPQERARRARRRRRRARRHDHDH